MNDIGRRETANGRGRRLARGEGGFSLIEMLVSVSIAGIVGVAAVPSANELYKKYALAGAVEQISFEVARARMQAVGQNKYVRVRFLDYNTYAIEGSRDNVSYTQIGASRDLPYGVKATLSASPTFNRRGLASAGTTISVTDGNSSRSIRVNMLGNSTVS